MINFNVTRSFSHFSSSNEELLEYNFLRIKKMSVRRLSPISKVALDLALHSIENEDIGFIVYASRHGELKYSYEILCGLNNDQAASPAKFSHSVHNSTGSYLTILEKLSCPVTAISAGEDSFSSGLIAAINHSMANSCSKVLLLFCDSIVPIEYEKKVGPHNQNIIFSSIIQANRNGKYSLCQTINKVENDNHQCVSFTNWISDDMKDSQLYLANTNWTYTRND